LARRAQRGQDLPARHHRSRGDLCRSRRQGHAGAGDRRHGQPIAAGATPGGGGGASALAQTPAPPAAPTSATPFKGGPERSNSEEAEGEVAPGEADFDDDDMENSLSLAAIEAELKPKVVETFDKIADAYKRLRRLQDQDIQNKLRNDSLSPAQERRYKKLKDEIISEVKSLRLNQARIDALVEQLYDINKRLVGYEGRLMRPASRARSSATTCSARSTSPPSRTTPRPSSRMIPPGPFSSIPSTQLSPSSSASSARSLRR
jgi:Sigma-70, non-essential region